MGKDWESRPCSEKVLALGFEVSKAHARLSLSLSLQFMGEI